MPPLSIMKTISTISVFDTFRSRWKVFALIYSAVLFSVYAEYYSLRYYPTFFPDLNIELCSQRSAVHVPWFYNGDFANSACNVTATGYLWAATYYFAVIPLLLGILIVSRLGTYRFLLTMAALFIYFWGVMFFVVGRYTP